MSTTQRRSLKRAAAGVSAGMLTLTGFAAFAAAPANAQPGFSFTRLAGVDRYATAAAIATNTFPTGSANVLVASGQNFPDALAGNYLAGFKSAPLLLTQTATLPQATKDALATLKASNVTILGGTSAVSTAVENALKAAGYTVTRIAGVDRYATAKEIAETPAATNVGTTAGAKTAILASGQNFADALTAGPLGYAKQFPVEITDPNTLSADTMKALQDLNIKNVIIAGGTAAVSTVVENQVKALNGGITITRLAGTTRQLTANAIADYEVANAGFSLTHVNLARGDDFADALSGGPHAGKELAPILLTDNPTTLGSAALNYLTTHANTLTSGHIFGGTAAVADAVKAAAEAAAQGTAGGATANPSTVAPGGTSTITAHFPGAPSGSTVTFTSAGAGCGTLSPTASTTNAAGDATTVYTAPGSGAGGTCTITATGPNGATQSVTITQTPAPAGQTVLPQLISASIVKTVTPSQATGTQPAGTYVQYVFNQDVSTATLNPSGFHVFDFSDNRYDGGSTATSTAIADKTSPAGFAGGNANAVDVIFTNTAPLPNGALNGPATPQDLTSSNTGLTLATVSGPQDVIAGTPAAVVKGGQSSPDGQAPIGANSSAVNAAGVTAAPDPESIGAPRAANPNQSGADTAAGFAAPGCAVTPPATTGSSCTAIDLTFDQAAFVTSASGTGFNILYTNQTTENQCFGPPAGSTNGGTGNTVASGNGTATLTIICQNDPTAPSTAVTAAQISRVIVQQGAVKAANGTLNPLEVTDTPHIAAKSPSLTAVVLSPGSNKVTYTFDQAVSNASGAFGYYTADGTQVTCGSLGVTCTIALSPTSSNQIAATFAGAIPAGEDVGQAVGGNVATGTVLSSVPLAGVNADDELGAANATATPVVAGTVDAPQLTAVKKTSASDSFGNTTFGAVYTFTTAVQIFGAPGRLHVYDQDGTEFDCTTAIQGTTASTGANTVRCTAFVGSISGIAPTALQASAFTLGTADYSVVLGAGVPNTTSTNPNPEGGVGVTA